MVVDFFIDIEFVLGRFHNELPFPPTKDAYLFRERKILHPEFNKGQPITVK